MRTINGNVIKDRTLRRTEVDQALVNEKNRLHIRAGNKRAHTVVIDIIKENQFLQSGHLNPLKVVHRLLLLQSGTKHIKEDNVPFL